MEDFVTFEIAKKLKEKGFPIKTKTEGKWGLTELKEVDILPTISQVLKWLRDEKGLHICISLGEFSDWVYDISKIEGNVFCEAMDDFHSYEEATLAGVNYCLENLI